MGRLALILGLSFLLSSCATYSAKTREGLEAFSSRDFSRSESDYSKGAEEDGKDQLVYLFERGTVRRAAGHYEDSIKDFLLADKLSEIKDYTALATEAASVITTDAIRQYKGEEFEHVLVSAYLAMNYAALGKLEDAIVECRRVNRKLERLRSEGKRNYELNAFAQYLSGVLYEKERNWNDANIDYKKTSQILPEFSRIKKDLIKGALRTGNDADMNKWRRNFGVDNNDIEEARKELKSEGSVVLLYENGFAPEKITSPQWQELPEYRKRYNRHRAANLYLDGNLVARSEILYDVEKVAFQNLKQKYAGYIAKRIAGVVAREVIGDQIDKKTNNSGLGVLFKVAMYAANQADLRAWLTLPKDFQVARAEIAPGKYHATIRLENVSGALEAEKDLGEVEIKRPGDVAILSYRSMND